MVTNSRAFGSTGASALGLRAGSGGVSEGHRYARSTRACVPGLRCTGMRIAAGSMLKATPATMIGSDGASSMTDESGHRGHST